MGKTHTALEYLYRHRRSYHGIFWIRSENTTIIQQEYAQIGRALDTKAITGMDLNKSVEAAKDWLSSTGENSNHASYKFEIRRAEYVLRGAVAPYLRQC